jgi:hypothetical protein
LRRGHNVTLFDLSPENVAFARKKTAELSLVGNGFFVGDARDLSALKGRRFNGIVALASLPSHQKARTCFVPASRQNATRSWRNPDCRVFERVGDRKNIAHRRSGMVFRRPPF